MFYLAPLEHYDIWGIVDPKRCGYIGYIPWNMFKVLTFRDVCPHKFITINDIVSEHEQIVKDRDWYRDRCNYLEQKLKDLQDAK
jgi:hypothetical protein